MSNLPHSAELERAVISALVISPDVYQSVRSILEPSDFHVERNQWVYNAIIALNEHGTAVDFVTLSDELERAGKLVELGGSAYIFWPVAVCQLRRSVVRLQAKGHTV